MTVEGLRARVDDLHRRADQGVAPIPLDEASARLLKLRAASAYLTASTAGVGLDGYLTASEDKWPPEVMAVLERLDLLDKYDPQTLSGTLLRVDEARASGLISNWKGTLFEQEVVHLVDGMDLTLQEGEHSLRLAESARQPGWDAEVVVDGQVVDLVQMKATDRAQGIAEHLERYPEVPTVITTTEGAEAAGRRGLPVVDSGISNDNLEETLAPVVEAIDPVSAVHEFVPGIGLAVAVTAAAVRLQRGDDLAVVARWLTGESLVMTGAHVVGLAAEVTTGVVVARPVAAVSTRLLIRRAQTQSAARERSAELRRRVERLKAAATVA